MTKIRATGPSSMIQDRRGAGGLGGSLRGIPIPGRIGGGLIGVIITLAVVFLPRLLSGSGANSLVDTGDASNAAEVSNGSCNDELESIICGATEDVQGYWQREFQEQGQDYEVTQTVFFTGSTDTGCGQASSQTGPFYCPADHLVYFDLDFLTQLQDQFGAQGDLASQYIVAHEYGHHVQNLLGINRQVQSASQQNPDQANQYSVALELQADCLAGMWAHDANARNEFDQPNEIEEALNAAAAVGDDRIQQQTQGRIDPESFTHGTSEQRVTWFRRGFDSGDFNQCDTFSEILG
jgi:uncharacterized protein